MKLDQTILEVEQRANAKVGFWWIPREFNVVADALAKEAAELAARMLAEGDLSYV